MADTRNALLAAATESKKKINLQVIEDHHSTLMLMHKQQTHINEQIQIQE